MTARLSVSESQPSTTKATSTKKEFDDVMDQRLAEADEFYWKINQCQWRMIFAISNGKPFLA